MSGATTSRPAPDRLMHAARRGQLDLVAVWRLGRLSRSLPHLLAVLDELRHLGVGFVSIRNPGLDPTSVSGMLMLSIVGAFASYERELLRERVLAGVRRAQSKGTHRSRPRVTLNACPALALFDAGHSGREIASMLAVSRATHRRRLAEAAQNICSEPGQRGVALPIIPSPRLRPGVLGHR
ncbi:recombinase family protein [Myxococcota bacterium]|nr:recombinase family protein [Myxococcota bacterium]